MEAEGLVLVVDRARFTVEDETTVAVVDFELGELVTELELVGITELVKLIEALLDVEPKIVVYGGRLTWWLKS